MFRLQLGAKAEIPIVKLVTDVTKIDASGWKNVNKNQTVLGITHAIPGQEIVSEVPNKIISTFS